MLGPMTDYPIHPPRLTPIGLLRRRALIAEGLPVPDELHPPKSPNKIKRGRARVRIAKPAQTILGSPGSTRPRATWQHAGLVAAAKQEGLEIGDYEIETLPAPHEPPRLPRGKMAVYVFTASGQVLKIGMVSATNKKRYTHHHYKPESWHNNLSLSILNDPLWKPRLTRSTVGDWIRRNCERTNILLDGQLGRLTAVALEDWLIHHLKPRYEGGQFQGLPQPDPLTLLQRCVEQHGWRYHWRHCFVSRRPSGYPPTRWNLTPPRVNGHGELNPGGLTGSGKA
jgi:hypothetical protein